jgi:predicted GNAT family N-acyltransferase
MTQVPLYDSYDREQAQVDSRHYGVRVARNLSDIMQVVAIRSAVFISEQDCPFGEEFDGNDFCSTHFIGYMGTEPAACLRARFFADFAKLERLAVRHEFRRSRLSFQIVKAGIEFAKAKGYRQVYGHAQDRLVRFWSSFGARPMPARDRPLVFSDFSYTEMLLEADRVPNAITLATDPYVLIRPEGKWHEAGVLETSAARSATSPLRAIADEQHGAP